MTIKKNPDDYKTGFLLYLEIIKSLNLRETNSSNLRLEVQYESLIDWSQIHSFHFIKNWFLKKRKNPDQGSTCLSHTPPLGWGVPRDYFCLRLRIFF